MKQAATSRLMRHINRSGILDLIREKSPISRSQIAKELHMSLPTVMRIIDDLCREDLVHDLGSTESSGGRPRQLLEFMSHSYSVVGVDLGGTKMYGTVADLAGNVQTELYVPWGENGPESSFERLCELIEQLLQAPRPAGQRIRGIGIGTPGVTINETGVVEWAPSLGWRNLPLQKMVGERFHYPVFIENDVNLAALGELGFGAGRGMQNLVCIALGTGIGSGIVIGGALYHGKNKAAGEVGYLLPGLSYLDQPYEGFGALESEASGTGIGERARKLILERGLELDAEKMTSEAVFAAARNGEAWAQEVVDETVDYLSLMIANVSAILDPEAVILGGGVSLSADLLIDPIVKRIQGRIPYTPQIIASSLGRRAAVMGAIMLVLNATTDYVIVEKFQ